MASLEDSQVQSSQADENLPDEPLCLLFCAMRPCKHLRVLAYLRGADHVFAVEHED